MLSHTKFPSRCTVLDAFTLALQMLAMLLLVVCSGRQFWLLIEHGLIFAPFRISFWLAFIKVFGYELLALFLIIMGGAVADIINPTLRKYFYEYSEPMRDFFELLNVNSRTLSPGWRAVQKIIRTVSIVSCISIFCVPWTASAFSLMYDEVIPRLAICWLLARVAYVVKDLGLILWLQFHHR